MINFCIFFLTDSFSGIKTQGGCKFNDGFVINHVIQHNFTINISGLVPPELTVTPLVITESDSVTVNCQTPSSVPVYQCWLYSVRDQTSRVVSCHQTLTGTELMKMTHQSSPADIEVTCYYTVEQRGTKSQSPLSNSIIIQSLVPPELTVTPLVITESDSVTVNCQTPSSVPLSQCYFNFGKDKPAKPFSCQKTLTGTELLQITNQNSPAEVAVSCFYLKTHRAPNSNVFSISIRLPRPELTVTPLVITESDSVTVNCQTPSSVPVYQCHFTVMGLLLLRDSSCRQTVTGADLLDMTGQRSPAEVKLTCYYTVKLGERESTSTHSQTSSITVNPLHQPELTVTPLVIIESDSVTVKLGERESTSTDSQTSSINVQTNAETQSVPAATVTTGETSDLSSNTAVSSSTSPTASGETAGLSTSTSTSTSVDLASAIPEVSRSTLINSNEYINPTTGSLMKKLLVIVTSFGAIVGVTSLGLVLFCVKRRNVKSHYQRPQAKQTDELLEMRNISHGGLVPIGCNEGYSEITSAPGVASNTAKSKRLNNESDIYHVYATIAEEPAEAALPAALYSTLQAV
ncbi:mucin-2 [Betta splendens]|uniref:Mucin-2 n=1 Tax=Betta splendens TaxID=158456 RepID=A0A9W2XTL3_BETSP|nr:mucin-2 [Betta splendens]